ncbi:MAG TPA: metalloregulator ArsR/SmtB family transcription factor [Thermomicrobiales bacterium]
MSSLAQALSDETRLRLLHLLLSGDATVSELGAHLGLPQPRISTHLALLREAGLVAVETRGRQRTYRVDPDRVRSVLDALDAGAPPREDQAMTPRPRVEIDATPIRRARTCYDHLAGIAGVQLLDELLRRNWLTVADAHASRPQYGLTPAGVHAFHARGVDLGAAGKARRLFAYGCLDWSERRPHLAGALGAAVLDALRAAGIVRPADDSRAVTLSRPLADWLDKPIAAAGPATSR